MDFNELNLSENIRKAIQKKGFVNASEVQEKVIPAALAGKDLVGKSKTGTGKTAAFAIPLIENIMPRSGISALIIVPTRELAMQAKEEIVSIAVGSRLKVVSVFGGQSVFRQAQMLQMEPEIVVGTPGRILDLIDRKHLSFQHARFLILDEADKMFDMGFRDDIEKIISFFPKHRQTMLFSATMPKEIMELAEHHLKRDRIFFDLSEDNAPVDEIEQFVAMVDPKRKVDTLFQILCKDNSKTLIFCKTKRTVDWLEHQLGKRGLKTIAIHGDKPQNARIRAVENYKESKNAVLLATDIVARGIHVDDISLVVNFDFPHDSESYIHRIRRTARQGRKGIAITFCENVMELNDLERIARKHNTSIKKLQMQ